MARQGHLFWPAKPLPRGFTYRAPFLHVFTEAGLFLFNVETGVWVASAAGTRRLQPLVASDGHLCLMTSPGSGSAALSKLASAQNAAAAVASGGTAALVYLPPPRQSMFAAAAAQKRRNTSLLTTPLVRPLGTGQSGERQLELGSVVPLDATAKARVRCTLTWPVLSQNPCYQTLYCVP